MINIALQKNEQGFFVPHTMQCQEEARVFRTHQVVKAKLTGAQNPRSLKQLRAYWKLCQIVADNTDRPEYANRNMVDWRLRNALQFYDTDYIYVKNGQVSFKVRSISFKNLKHAEANGYFDRAFDLISNALKIPLTEMIRQANS